MGKLNITVGQCLALLLWLAVQTAGAASVVSLFCLLAPVESAAAAADHQESATVRRFERALAKVQPLLARYGYGAAFAAVMVEGMGIPTPGQTLLMAGALEAAEGRMNIAVLLFVVTAAAALGNSVGYAVGRWGGRVVTEQAQGQLAAPAAPRGSFQTARRPGYLASAISRRAKAVERNRRRCPANALVDLHGVQRRRRDSLDMQLGSRNLFLGSGPPFHCGFFSQALPVAVCAERDRFCCFADVHAALEKSTQ